MIVKDTPANRRKCICPQCPSYPKDCPGEMLYCGRDQSRCEIRPTGCICNACPVFIDNQLRGMYFCDKERSAEGGFSMRKKRRDEDPAFYQMVAELKEVASTGESIIKSMGSLKKMPFAFSDIHFVPAQVSRIPLNKEDGVSTAVVIGPKAKKPLRISIPIMISGMSFGATSKNVKLAIARAVAETRIAMNSGEGGILEEELSIAPGRMIGQYATGRFGVNEDVIKRVAAVEIRFGQGAYPGKGSYLPASKMTEEVARIRGLKGGEAAYSPAHHHDMTKPEDIRAKVAWLRNLTGGVPIGAKIGCGRIEDDIAVLTGVGVDFISIDGFGGGTGATESYVRDNVGLPLIAALPRARRCLEKLGKSGSISLIAGGGLRTSADFAKCLALGADAVYIGTSALIAINCEQYRICHTGMCPTGVTTQIPSLAGQVDPAEGAARLSNFLRASSREMANLARVVGKDDIGKLDCDDLVALDRNLSALAGIRWLDGQKHPISQ